MKREVKRAAPNPASSCATCFRPGIVSEDQKNADGARGLGRSIRFECASGHVWTADARDAEAHGRFLQRLDGS